MKMQWVGVVTCALALSACQKGSDEAATGAQDTATLDAPAVLEPAPAVVGRGTDPTKPEYWAGPNYQIKSVPTTHGAIVHVVKDGYLEVVSQGNGEYKLTVQDAADQWRPDWSDVVLTWHEGTEYCAPLPPRPKMALDADAKATAEAELAYAKAVKDAEKDALGDVKRKFIAKAAVTLHDKDDEHTDHLIEICPIDPAKSGDLSGILISTSKQGGGHDGISHGEG